MPMASTTMPERPRTPSAGRAVAGHGVDMSFVEDAAGAAIGATTMIAVRRPDVASHRRVAASHRKQ